jgi:hypothetical protein
LPANGYRWLRRNTNSILATSTSVNAQHAEQEPTGRTRDFGHEDEEDAGQDDGGQQRHQHERADDQTKRCSHAT